MSGIPRHPASCSVATCNLVDRVGNAVQRAIAEMAEGYGLAEVGYSIPASLAVLSGLDPRHDDEPYIDQLVLAYTGGPGGPSADGWLTFAGLTDAGVLQWNSVELDELRFPIRIDSQRIAIDTEGVGTAARSARGRARAHAHRRRDRVHVPERWHGQPAPGRARRRAGRDGVAGDARTRRHRVRDRPVRALAIAAGDGAPQPVLRRWWLRRPARARAGSRRQGRERADHQPPAGVREATEWRWTTRARSIPRRRSASARRCDRAERLPGTSLRARPQTHVFREERISVSENGEYRRAVCAVLGGSPEVPQGRRGARRGDSPGGVCGLVRHGGRDGGAHDPSQGGRRHQLPDVRRVHPAERRDRLREEVRREGAPELLLDAAGDGHQDGHRPADRPRARRLGATPAVARRQAHPAVHHERAEELEPARRLLQGALVGSTASTATRSPTAQARPASCGGRTRSRT